MIAAVYARKSTAQGDVAEEAKSVARQIDGARAFIAAKHWTLDDIAWIEPIGAIWTQSRAPWAVIDPSAPNFPGQPPSRQPLIDAWQAAHGG